MRGKNTFVSLFWTFDPCWWILNANLLYFSVRYCTRNKNCTRKIECTVHTTKSVLEYTFLPKYLKFSIFRRRTVTGVPRSWTWAAQRPISSTRWRSTVSKNGDWGLRAPSTAPLPFRGPCVLSTQPPPSTWHLCSFLTIFFQTKQCCFDAVGVVGFGGLGGGGWRPRDLATRN